MTEQNLDSRRKCKRIFFTEADNIEGAIVVAEMAYQDIPIKFLSLSEGGVSFQVERILAQQIAKDQVVILKKKGTGLLAFLNNIELEVKYVLDYGIVLQLTIGCKFNELPGTVRNEIKKIVNAKINS
jgi:hypothetical protein